MARVKRRRAPNPLSAADAAYWRAVRAAQAKHEKNGGLRRSGPYFRATARYILEGYERRFATGDEWALVNTLDTCAIHELALPEWAAREWVRRIHAADRFKVASWDDVLPRIKSKGRKLATLRLEQRWTLPVFFAVHSEHQRGTPIDDALFAHLVEHYQWPISGALAKKLYYAAAAQLPGLVELFAGPKRRTSTIRSNS
jgi:hypothetical protein